jgi:hypothetical protein
LAAGCSNWTEHFARVFPAFSRKRPLRNRCLRIQLQIVCDITGTFISKENRYEDHTFASTIQNLPGVE